MIGLILISHSDLARELLGAAEFILGKLDQVETISVHAQLDPAKVQKQVTAAIGQVDSGQGVLILTDMFGGTPNNISLAFLEEGRVEVVTGVNLPMIIKAATSRKDTTPADLGREVCAAGRSAISSAGEILSS